MAAMMKKIILPILLFSFISAVAQKKKVSNYVNPFIGTAAHGHTYPGATLPFGMIQLSPDNGTQGWDWCSGYNYSDTVLAGFSHTHLSGTGIGDLCDISMLPIINQKKDTLHKKTSFYHTNEKAKPGFYSVALNNGVLVNLTTSKRVGYHQYTFPKNCTPQIQLDLGWAINWDSPTSSSLEKINDSTFSGYRFSTGWAKNQKVFFVVQFNTPVIKIDTFRYKSNTGIIGYFEFPKGSSKIEAKVALSFTSTANAINNLTEIKGQSFEQVKQKAANIWETELSKIVIESFDTTVLTNFYSALYHTYQAPALFSDLGTPDTYTTHSLWDTFRAANPLFSITQPQLIPNIINSFLNFYDKTGLLPVWELMGWEANTMTGYHAVPIITDAILKDIKGFDVQKAYEAIIKSSMQNIRGTDAYRKYGFVPQDKQGWSATITLEYAYDDWCIAQVAKKLNKLQDHATYTKRSLYYKNIFDVKTGFFRAKNSDGNFLQNFDPYYSEHGFDGQYIEGTAWQHTWFVPHDIEGMMKLYGSKANFTTKLDSLWTVSSNMNGTDVSNDITGLIGQYAHGNEPSHHIAYIYSAINEPKKTAEKTRQIMQTLYKPTTDGLCGNEDCGQMSAWYVWSALGFYPMNPSSGQYVFGSPLITKATITLPNNKKFIVSVQNNSYVNKYMKSIKLNGKPYSLNHINHKTIAQGGELTILMGKE